MHQSEVVNVHIGQAGLQTGHAFWELACVEHGISPNGTVEGDDALNEDTDFITFFHETPSGQHVPRCLLVDLEPTVMDEIRTGRYHRLFHPDLMYNGKEDAGNNFARGYYTMGRKFITGMVEKTRHITEGCDSLQGFMIFNSFGGGTGSGLTSLYTDRLKVEFGRKACVQVSIYPGKRLATSTVEPYNSLMISDRTMDTSDVCIFMDNESIYNICSRGLKMEAPTFVDTNRIIAPMIAAMTSTLRYGGTLNCSLNEMRTNLIPFPRIHFPMLSYAPMLCENIQDHESMTTQEMMRELFEDYNQSVNVNLKNGKYMASCLIYKGDHGVCDIYAGIKAAKAKRCGSNWVDWCPTGFKVGLTHQKPIHHPIASSEFFSRSLLMIYNHTSIGQTFETLSDKFDQLYRKRAFIHWYVGEGMEENEFVEARCSISTLINDFHLITEETEEEQSNNKTQITDEAEYLQRFQPFFYEKTSQTFTNPEPFSISEPQFREWMSIYEGEEDEKHVKRRPKQKKNHMLGPKSPGFQADTVPADEDEEQIEIEQQEPEVVQQQEEEPVEIEEED